jgi:hypothetical protein
LRFVSDYLQVAGAQRTLYFYLPGVHLNSVHPHVLETPLLAVG